MTPRLTVFATALVATALLAGQAIDGWMSRPSASELTAATSHTPPRKPGTPPDRGGRRATPHGSASATAPRDGDRGTAPDPGKRPRSPGAAASATPPPPQRPGQRPTSGPDARGVTSRTRAGGVALTFDDGPDPTYTPQILALLREHHIRATFCLVGREVAKYPALVRQIVREGHTLCNHSWRHDLRLADRSSDAIEADVLRTDEAIHRAVPQAEVPFFRQPGGKWTQREIGIIQRLGMTPLGWSVDPSDWREPAADTIVARVLGSAKPGAIVLSHDAGGDRHRTIEAYHQIIPDLLEKYRIVGIR